jgi:hypothetical protein
VIVADAVLVFWTCHTDTPTPPASETFASVVTVKLALPVFELTPEVSTGEDVAAPENSIM